MTERERKPERLWSSEYGETWTKRNEMGVKEIDAHYVEQFGVSRLSLLERFFEHLDEDARILEVGTNIGTQLLCLRELGFTELYGIDIQREAIEWAHRSRPELDIVEGNLFDIPFKTGFFDVVFTSGVLIHVHSDDLDTAMDEIVRCSDAYVYGHEYFAEEYTEITHNGHDGVLWKGDYVSRYLEGRPLERVDEELLDHRGSDNVDVEFLLRKQ
ncbi:pseudaminic acid biosynthesis-associated methylase [Haloarchaeobius sp. DT45]|uniref:pseudaminic acid biosynthesis-associated methylase n=1 Tax=Haloarchaeobius sp. DT45 TaxID=3446116 RepID=UPI003F6B928A